MPTRSLSSAPARVVIAGGGFAALEAALALRALAGDRVHLTLVCADPWLRYRPAATAEAFDELAPRIYDLHAIASNLGAGYRQATVEAVASERHYLRLSSGERLPYDALILATGARATASVLGALLFRDQRDVPLFRGLLEGLKAGTVARPAFVVPPGPGWPLPLYELALLSAAQAEKLGADVEISLVTPEREPLACFGPRVSRTVADLLTARGVRFLGGSIAVAVGRDGTLTLQFEGSLKADRVVTAPQLRGRRISGVPASWWGFVPTDAVGRVEGLQDVYAAGDMTAFPLKHGGIAAQQADRVAQTIAASLDVAPLAERHGFVLQARLLSGERALILRTELDWQGRPAAGGAAHADTDRADAAAKVFGRYLTPYLESLQPADRHAAHTATFSTQAE